MWVPFWRPFPGNEAHKLLSRGPKGGVLGGGQKVYVEKVYVLFRSPRDVRANDPGTSAGYLAQNFLFGLFFFVFFVPQLLARPLCRNVSGIFVVKILEDFAGDLPGGFFWALFPTKMRRKNPATKSAKKSGSSKIEIREKSVLPKSDPKNCTQRALRDILMSRGKN